MSGEIFVPVFPVEQPIGCFYIGVMPSKDLFKISYADIREIESDFDNYIGIQRRLNKDRVRDIAEFVGSIDATFPTSVVLAVPGNCAEFLSDGRLRIFEGIDPSTGEKIDLDKVARILDGQHRVEGLKVAGNEIFQIPVSIFVDADLADQAYIFATVNLAQTKVNKSLVYDLLDHAKARSPQKTAHEIVVAFDRLPNSPFYKSIKRLGAATPGREGETLAQATVVNGILPLISKNPNKDQYALAKSKWFSKGLETLSFEEAPLRQLWIDEKDSEIAKILLEYFKAVQERWPSAWSSRERGNILPRTNGYMALIRLFKNIYLKERFMMNDDNWLIDKSVYAKYFAESDLEDKDFTVENFKPGTSGSASLYKKLREDLKV